MSSCLQDPIYELTIRALHKSQGLDLSQLNHLSLPLPGASMSADIGVYDESPPNESDARPTISLFEQWEEGHMCPELPMQGITHSPSRW